MIWSSLFPNAVLQTWRRTGLTGRLATGLLAIIVFTLVWDALANMVDARIRWPLTGLAAAAGWARLGLSIRPMLVLMIVGFAFDSVSGAPFGVFPLVFLSTYAVLASTSLLLGSEMDPVTGSILPFLGMGFGVFVLWVFASVIASAPINPIPLLIAWVTSCVFYALFEGLFDLHSFKTSATSG
ncbi:MAG: hypothetical protein AAFR41_02690 [Pseudomonadota bacterium]